MDNKKVFYIDKKINIVGLILDIIGHAIAIAALVVTFATLSEMQADRTATYQPNLLIKDFVFRVETTCALVNERVKIQAKLPETVYVPSYDTYDNITRDIWSRTGTELTDGLVMANVGVGTAKNVRIRISKKFVESCYELISKQQIDDYTLNLGKFDLYPMRKSAFDYDQVNDYAYILPVSSTNEEIIIPLHYDIYDALVSVYSTILYREIVFSDGLSDLFKFFHDLDIPLLPIELTYYDVQGKPYHEIVYMKLDIGTLFLRGKEPSIANLKLTVVK